MSDDIEYLANYKPNQLYTNPGKAGAYATIAGESESEEVIAEIDITNRCKLAVSAFYVNDRKDCSLIRFSEAMVPQENMWVQKTRLSLDNINVAALGSLLSSSKGVELVRELAETPELHHDIYAVAAKREALAEFETKLQSQVSEGEWQTFFEANSWIFGHGLNYIFLDKVAPKLTAATTGSTFDRPGKIVDALMRTRAEVSQYVLVEIKKNGTDLLRQVATPYRPGCWGVSDEVSNAVTQIQKTAFEFARGRFRDGMKGSDGTDTGETVYSIEPRSYLVVGDLTQLQGNDDKIACFELYRRNIRSPEILTFDELFYRARFIVENISRDKHAVG